MITFITHLRVIPQHAGAFETLIADVCAKVRDNEPGVLHYSFAKSVADPNTYVVIEVYRDEAVHTAHMQTAWVKESLPKTARLIEGKFDIKQYVSPGTEPLRRAPQTVLPPLRNGGGDSE